MKTRKFIALFLAVLMCFSALSVSVFATDEQTVPVIYVPGFMSTTIYSGIGTPEQKQLFPPESSEITQQIKLAVPDIISFFATSDWDAMLDAINPVFFELLGDSFCDNNGNVKEGTGTIWQYPDEETVSTSAETDFKYDWRLPPLVLADQLSDYIEYVKLCTGSDKVSLICHSFGNTVGMSYIAKYGTDSLDGFVCNASAFMGETYNGELMTGQLRISGEALINYLQDNVFVGTEYEEVATALCGLLELLNVVDAVEANANYAIDKIIDRAAKEVFLQWFGKWPSVWAMVPDEYYAQARQFVFEGSLADEDCSGLLAKLDEYDSVVRAHKQEILTEASQLNFGVVARYNIQKLPITKNPTALTDNNIDVKYASFGATTSDYNSTLPDGYTQARFTDINYISPDNMIDASTCMFPERTWFIKNMNHSGSCDDLDTLFYNILFKDGYTVRSDPQFSQFLIYDINTDTLAPLTEITEPEPSTVSVIVMLLKQLKNLILGLLRVVGVVE